VARATAIEPAALATESLVNGAGEELFRLAAVHRLEDGGYRILKEHIDR